MWRSNRERRTDIWNVFSCINCWIESKYWGQCLKYWISARYCLSNRMWSLHAESCIIFLLSAFHRSFMNHSQDPLGFLLLSGILWNIILDQRFSFIFIGCKNYRTFFLSVMPAAVKWLWISELGIWFNRDILVLRQKIIYFKVFLPPLYCLPIIQIHRIRRIVQTFAAVTFLTFLKIHL